METILSQYTAVPDDIAVVRYNMVMDREGTTYTSSLVRCAGMVSPAHDINVCTLSSVNSVLILEIRLLQKSYNENMNCG